MSFYQTRTVSKTITAPAAGRYLIHIYCKIDGDPAPRDPQECRIHVTSDGEEFFTEQYAWADNNWQEYDAYVEWEAGDHEVSFTTEPVHPELRPLRTKMEYRIVSVRVEGPFERSHWVHPPGYDKLYTRPAPPTDPAERRAYASEVLERFASRAFRRPVSPETLAKLVDLAEATYSLEGKTFEQGIGQAVVAILASPKFLFHLEDVEPDSDVEFTAVIDEYSLAARLSFALWRSIPDEALTELAAKGQLRENFAAQVRRMIADPKARAFVEGFSQQWLQVNAITDIPINSEAIMALESTGAEESSEALADARPGAGRGRGQRGAGGQRPRGRFGFGGRRRAEYTGTELTPEVRAAMKHEVEAYFNFVMREDRSVLEFLDSDYAFVNADLAKLYGLPAVEGPELRKVDLPADSPRGGMLTMGSVLTVTSNPTRTSPVKRGKWVLENILGAPTAPPPPDVPALEDTLAKAGDRKPTQREALAIHRDNPLCASCHARMDPLGLALESFNGFGRYRTVESEQPIDPTGELITGERFAGVTELKQALADNHQLEFYRTLAGKLLTYALGRGMEYYDVATIDEIASRMQADEGRFSALLMGVLESAPFHQRLTATVVDSAADTTHIGAVP
jgi:hypothetical protein